MNEGDAALREVDLHPFMAVVGLGQVAALKHLWYATRPEFAIAIAAPLSRSFTQTALARASPFAPGTWSRKD